MITRREQLLAERDAIRRQRLEIERLLAAREAREELLKFTKYLMPDPNDPDDPEKSRYRDAEHHRLLALFLMGVVRGKIMRLAISMPPQHGKSELSTRRLPAFYSGKYPYKHLMCGTYSQDFANEFGDDVRSIILSERFAEVFPECELRTGSKAKDHMTTTQGGKLSFLGRGGAGTGRPADGFIIDDPIKNAVEAASLATRDEVWNWYTKVANTRIHKLSWQIIIQTRWHEDDLIGRLTDPRNPYYDPEVARQWVVVNIPAILEPPDEEVAKLLNKKVGDLLWPERFSREQFETAKRMDPQGFSALYQGRPVPAEGAFFKRDIINTYDRNELPPRAEWRAYGSADMAVGTKKHNDKSCLGSWVIDKNWNAYLLPDLYWEKKAADVTVEHIIVRAKNYKWMTFFGETGQIDRAVGPFLRRQMREHKVYFAIETFPTVGDKGARAISARGLMALGKIRFPKFAQWWPSALDQLLSFTGIGDDREDDFVDMVSIFGMGLDKQLSGSGIVIEEKKDNVIRVGTYRWIKQQTERKERARRERAALAGW